MSPTELEHYVTTMRNLGVKSFRTGDLQIDLGPAPAREAPPPETDAPILPPKKTEYERLLYACTEGIPEDE